VKADAASRTLPVFQLYVVAVVVGIAAGIGAVVFRGLIAIFHNLLFLGRLSWAYDATLHTPAGPWGPWVIAVPVLGALAVAVLVQNFAPEAKGHGVPEVMDAIHHNRGVIRPVVALIKSLASALSIGSGGAVGREGPIIQIGSAFGSSLGQWLRVPVWQRVTLIAAGAGGGIAATFNTPVGGILFAVEITMQEVSARTLVPVAIATTTATYIGRLFYGPHPSFVIPSFETPYFHLTNPWLLPLYVGLGLLLGVASVAYIRSLYAFEDFFERWVPGGYPVRHMLGMAVVGILFYLLLRTTGHYYVEGIGYATVQDVLTGAAHSAGFLLLLCLLKLVATSLTLGSGASGGIFSPGLFMGATLGASYGLLIQQLIPGMSFSPPAFAVAGMAGMIGGSTGAALAAVVMIFEMTLDYDVIIPMTITVALAYGIRRVLCPESIYSMKLARRGRFVPDSLRASPHELLRAADVMNRFGAVLPASSSLDQAVRMLSERGDLAWFLAVDGEDVVGAAQRAEVLGARGERGGGASLGEIVSKHSVRVDPRESLLRVLEALRVNGASIALVVESAARLQPEAVLGIVTKAEIADALLQANAAFEG
jgi:CIC family chloride channel protein